MLILRYTAGYHREACELSYGDIKKALGLSRQSIATAIKGLEEKQIVFKKSSEKSNIFQVNYDFALWKTSKADLTSKLDLTSQADFTTTSKPQLTRYLLKENTKEISSSSSAAAKKLPIECFPNVEKLKAPTPSEVLDYARELGQSDTLAEKFWQYYNASGWKTKGGSPLTNWQDTFLYWVTKEKQKGMPKPAPKQKKMPPADNAEAYKGFVVNLDRWDDSDLTSRIPETASESPTEAVEPAHREITPEAVESGSEGRTAGSEGKSGGECESLVPGMEVFDPALAAFILKMREGRAI